MYSWEISLGNLTNEHLSRLPEPTKFMPYYLRKCLKLYLSQTRKLSRYLFLTVNDSSYGLVSILNSIVSLHDPLQCLKSLFRMHSVRFLSYSKKGKSAKMTTCCRSLSFAFTCCHLFSLVVNRCHLLSFVVKRCHTLSYIFFPGISIVIAVPDSC